MADSDLEMAIRAGYSLPASTPIARDTRGMINQTYFVGDDLVLTVFQNQDIRRIELIARILSEERSGFLPKLVDSNSGVLWSVDGKPAVMAKRIEGTHYVGIDHSVKAPLPLSGHISIANCFWALHAELERFKDLATALGQVDYAAPSALTQTRIVLPDYVKTGRVGKLVEGYLKQDEGPSLLYPGLVHHDFERQNTLHRSDGVVAGVVDPDSLKLGDILFEYCRCMVNFMFTDPAYTPQHADIYLAALEKSGLIQLEDVELIGPLIKLFIAKDLVDYCIYESDPPKTNLRKLTSIYELVLLRTDEYFENFHASAGALESRKNDNEPNLRL